MGWLVWWWGCGGGAPVVDPVEGPEHPVSSTAIAPEPEGPAPPLVFSDGRVPRNLLAISLDTTRRDFVGRYAGTDSTPFLDARLAEGVVLEDHRSCSNWTAPSMTCATTGHSPLDLGYWPSSQDPRVAPVPDDLPTLARALADHGWDTRLVTSNPVFSNDFGTAQGFGTVVLRDFESADVIALRARAEADTLPVDRPWYLHLHFFDPHQPFCPPEDYLAGLDLLPEIGLDVCGELPLGVDRWPDASAACRQALLDRAGVAYRGELRYWDDTLAALWADLDAQGALDDTLVVFFTDHGEQLMERGVIDHGFQLYAEENRAVAGFWAKTLAPGVWRGPTLHTDLPVTVLDLHGLSAAPTATGIPLGAADEDRVRRLFAYSVLDYGVPQLSVVQGDRQLHYAWDGVRSFHHLDTDPAELVDRYPDGDPGLLWDEMTPFVDEVAALWPHLPPPTSPGR